MPPRNSETPMVCAIVLAAGRSRRMGSQKLLLPLGGRPLIARVVDEVLRSPVDRVFVVVGHDGQRIAEALSGRQVSFVLNPLENSEMLDSVRAGLRALPPECAGALIVLGDQPGLTAEVVASLVRAFRTTPRGILVPVHRGRRGHPLLIAMRYRDEILTSHDTAGLRGLLEAHRDDILEVEAGTDDIFEDMDEPADYAKFAARFAASQQGNATRD
jgi:molybdenum cofactor cytidylyltransferase